jgi:hypothetical protein
VGAPRSGSHLVAFADVRRSRYCTWPQAGQGLDGAGFRGSLITSWCSDSSGSRRTPALSGSSDWLRAQRSLPLIERRGGQAANPSHWRRLRAMGALNMLRPIMAQIFSDLHSTAGLLDRPALVRRDPQHDDSARPTDPGARRCPRFFAAPWVNYPMSDALKKASRYRNGILDR